MTSTLSVRGLRCSSRGGLKEEEFSRGVGEGGGSRRRRTSQWCGEGEEPHREGSFNGEGRRRRLAEDKDTSVVYGGGGGFRKRRIPQWCGEGEKAHGEGQVNSVERGRRL